MALACTLHGLGSRSYTGYESISFVQSKITFERANRTYQPGEIVVGVFNVTSVPTFMPEIYGLKLEFEGEVGVKDGCKDSEDLTKIVSLKKYIIGNGYKKLGSLKEGEYKFEFTVPQDSPATFSTGKYGWVKYRVKCIGHQYGTTQMHALSSETLTVTASAVQQWKNSRYYIQPMTAQMKISSFVFSTSIHLWVSTDQKCYQPGRKIRFEIKVTNGGGKNVRAMMVQLQQVVSYDLKATRSKQIETILLPEIVKGPGVPLNSIEIWNGKLKIPADLQPSLQGELSKPIPISFQYNLQVTLQMAGDLIPNVVEKFPIEIGCPLRSTISSPNEIRNSIGRDFASRDVTSSELTRRMSMISITPSLPDYDAAIGRSRHGALPPSYYSCIELSLAETENEN